MPDFDLVVIGAGAAGLSVAAGAAQLGASVALIERERMGGDCLNTGCVPSKALLAASHAARTVRDAAQFGVITSEPVIDWDRVRSHVSGVIAALAPVDSEQRFNALGVTVLRGEARFTDPATIRVEGRSITARRFIIAAGSQPAVPSIRGLESVSYWTNHSLFDLSEKPDHLLILGGGPIGLEMADAFSCLGCRVTILEAGRIAAKEDPELVDGLRRVLVARGVVFREAIKVTGVTAGSTLAATMASPVSAPSASLLPGLPSPVSTGLAVQLVDGTQVEGSHLLVAVGRTPNLVALNLAAASIQAGPAGVVTDQGLRSVTNKRVFAIGDIADPIGIGPRAFTHVGSYHAGIIIRRVLFRLPARVDYSALPRVVYTDPELAQTGLTEAEAVAAGLKVQVLRWPMADNDRAVAERATTGLVKLVVHRSQIVGAGILGAHAGEMINQWTLAIAQRTKLSALAGLIVPYPTRSEAAKRAAGSFFAPRLFSARTKALVRLLSRLP